MTEKDKEIARLVQKYAFNDEETFTLELEYLCTLVERDQLKKLINKSLSNLL